METDGVPKEERRKLRAELESEIADAKASAHLSKGSKVDVSKLNEKIFAVRAFLKDSKNEGGSSSSKVISATEVVSSRKSVLSQPLSTTFPKVIGEKRDETPVVQRETSLATRSIAGSNASSTKSLVARRNVSSAER